MTAAPAAARALVGLSSRPSSPQSLKPGLLQGSLPQPRLYHPTAPSVLSRKILAGAQAQAEGKPSCNCTLTVRSFISIQGSYLPSERVSGSPFSHANLAFANAGPPAEAARVSTSTSTTPPRARAIASQAVGTPPPPSRSKSELAPWVALGAMIGAVVCIVVFWGWLVTLWTSAMRLAREMLHVGARRQKGGKASAIMILRLCFSNMCS